MCVVFSFLHLIFTLTIIAGNNLTNSIMNCLEFCNRLMIEIRLLHNLCEIFSFSSIFLEFKPFELFRPLERWAGQPVYIGLNKPV